MTSHFIAFEGGEGAGKTTQIAHLKSWLEAHGHKVVTGNDPGTTDFGKQVRKIIKYDAAPFQNLRPVEELVLTAAAKVVHYREFVLPNLEAGNWVISDRFNLSSQVYEGHVTQNAHWKQIVYRLMDNLLSPYWPELTVVLDISPTTGLARKREQNPADGTRYEDKPKQFHKLVREGFQTLAESYKLNCHLIDGERPETDVFTDVLKTVSTTFKLT